MTPFIYKVPGDVMEFFCQNLIHTGMSNLPRTPDSATGRVSNSRNSQIANRLELFHGPSEI
jgi:hypothetical protein